MEIPVTCSRNKKKYSINIRDILAFEPNYSDNIDNQGIWTLKCPGCRNAHTRIAGAELGYVALNYPIQFLKSIPKGITEEEIDTFTTKLKDENTDILLALDIET